MLKMFSEVMCIIPTLNEEKTIYEVISTAKHFANHVLVVDGFSVDDTYINSKEAGAEVIFQEGKGKGNALRTVFKEIKEYDICVIIDGDGTYDPMEMGKIIKPIIEGGADLVVGSRLQGKMEKGSISRTNIVGNNFFNFLINFLYKGKVTDSQSGYRAMTSKAVNVINIKSEGFEVETEITIKALKKGLKIIEVPITYRKRRGSSTKLKPIKAGSRIIKTIFKYLIFTSD
jgi:dolichol-phosphate mannosyltransferase